MKEIDADIFYQPLTKQTSKAYFKSMFVFAIHTGAKVFVIEAPRKASGNVVLAGLLSGLAHLGKHESEDEKTQTHVFTTPTIPKIPKAFWWALDCKGPLEAISTLRPKNHIGLVVVPNCKDTETMQEKTGMVVISAKLTE